MTRWQILEWLSFAFVAVTVCIILSLRPVPSIYSDNDTGRYVRDLYLFCDQASFEKRSISQDLSYQLFYSTFWPVCMSASTEIFLFGVAAILPLTFLIFSRWQNATFLWACALLFSVYGFELMTNAMRQNFAMFFFFGGLKLVKTHTIRAVFLSVLAIFLHTSVFLFFPLLLWLSPLKISIKYIISFAGTSFTLIFVGLFAFSSKFAEVYAIFELLQTWSTEKYAESINLSFILFMTLPLYFTYCLRKYFDKSDDISDEKKAVIYSSVLIFVTYILFPTISYRVSMLAVPMQVFLVTTSSRSNPIIGGISLLGFIFHLSILLIISDHYSVLIHG